MACPPRRTSFAAAVGLKILLQTSEAVAGSSSSGSRPHLLREGDDLHTTSPGHQSSRAALIGYDGSEFLASDPVVLGPMDMERSSSSSSSSPSLVGRDQQQSVLGSNTVGERNRKSKSASVGVAKSSTIAKYRRTRRRRTTSSSTTGRRAAVGTTANKYADSTASSRSPPHSSTTSGSAPLGPSKSASAGSHELLRRSTGGEHEYTHTKDSYSSIRSTSDGGRPVVSIGTSRPSSGIGHPSDRSINVKQSSEVMLLGQRGTTVTATITLSVAEVCDQSAVLVSSGSIDEACKGACIAQEEHCYGRQPSDSYYDAPATTPDMCSDACLNAMDAHETAFQNCGGYAPVGSAQRHRFDCAGIPDSATVEEACDQSAVLVGSSSTSATCTNACVAKEEHCYGLQPSDLYWEPSSSPTPPDQCSDACFNAMDAHELACENCVGSVYSGSTQDHRDLCAETVEEMCNWGAIDYTSSGSNGTACKDGRLHCEAGTLLRPTAH